MPIGVYVACDDPFVADSVTHAITRDADCYAAAGQSDADVVVAEPHRMPAGGGRPVVVLACSDPVAAARLAVARGADGLAVWPDDASALAGIVVQAAARRAPDANGIVIAVVAARGGAGATTVAAHLAAALAPDALLVDLCGGAAGQALYADAGADPAITLGAAPAIVVEPSVRAVRAAAAAHAAGVSCLYGGDAPPVAGASFASTLRAAASISIVDGPIADADVTVLVCGADAGSIRAALPMLGAGRVQVVLNRSARGRVTRRQARRALGLDAIAVVPDDPRLMRAADRGRVARGGPGRRAIARLARRIAKESR